MPGADINDGHLLDKIRQPGASPESDGEYITYVIISYVMIYVTNAQVRPGLGLG